MVLTKQPNSRLCFLCGIENPIGLNLAFWQNEERVFTRVVLDEPYQSYPGVAHGGVVTAILDETMGRAIIGLRENFAFTAKLETRFLRPVPLETPLVASGWITRERKQWYYAEGELRIEETGEVVATATATFAHLPEEQVRELSNHLDFWEVVEDAPSHAPPAITEDPPNEI